MSVRSPYNGGIKAPPTIAVHNNPETCGFRSPIPSMVNVKIVGNMIELNNPTVRIDHIDINPYVFIEIRIIPMASMAKILNTLDGL